MVRREKSLRRTVNRRDSVKLPKKKQAQLRVSMLRATIVKRAGEAQFLPSCAKQHVRSFCPRNKVCLVQQWITFTIFL